MQHSFLQSPEWETFQKSIGRKTWRVGPVLLIKHTLPRGFNYLYCPRPYFKNGLVSILADIKKIATEEKSIFLKTDFQSPQILPRGIFCKIANSLQPQKTLILDLEQPENQIFKKMHEKTRYNIKLAERSGVEVRQGCNFDLFWHLLTGTANRDGFRTHDKMYYKKLSEIKNRDFSNEFFAAYYNEKLLAAALVNFYKPANTVTYLHGASSREEKQVMAPHLLHWRIIQEAKRRGYLNYDFWGIDSNRWPGLTRFKMGFGGSMIEFPYSVDVIYRPLLYKIYTMARKLLRKYI